MTGVRTTVYLSPTLLAQAKVLGLNVSAILQDALRDEVNARKGELRQFIELGETSQAQLDTLNKLDEAEPHDHL